MSTDSWGTKMDDEEFKAWYGYDRADKELFEPPVKDCDSAATAVIDPNVENSSNRERTVTE